MANKDEFDPQLLWDEKARLSELVNIPRDLANTDHGVLLSDRIEHFCTGPYKLIDPFDAQYLRPAGYVLRVGRNYAIRDERNRLEIGEKLRIEPYQVAVIQILETLNLPEFLIGRWNIRVSLAYKGLLWVGGAQVDPGWRGRLLCPIYNLSTEPVELACGEELAMIDFVTTTPFVDGVSKPFQWWDKKLIFQQYRTDLCSGVEETIESINKKVAEDGDSLKRSLADNSSKLFKTLQDAQDRINSRIDTFLTLIFTVVAVLFAGLGIIATKGNDDPTFVSSPIWVAAVALYFALKPCAIAWAESKKPETTEDKVSGAGNGTPWIRMMRLSVTEIIAATLIIGGSIAFNLAHAHVSARTLRNQVRQTSELKEDLKDQKQEFESEIQVLKSQTDARIRALQAIIDATHKK